MGELILKDYLNIVIKIQTYNIDRLFKSKFTYTYHTLHCMYCHLKNIFAFPILVALQLIIQTYFFEKVQDVKRSFEEFVNYFNSIPNLYQNN